MPTSDSLPSVLVVGAGPAGIFAALRTAERGARTTLVTSSEIGGMAANDGPVPVRTLAHAARLMRETRQLGLYGIRAGEPRLDYSMLLERVRKIVSEVVENSTFRPQLKEAGVVVREKLGLCRFVDPRTIEAESSERFTADRIIICTGGQARTLRVPGSGHVSSHSGAWAMKSVPESLLVIGGGATGLQVASIFAAFGSEVSLFEVRPRILAGEDEDVSAAVADGFRRRGIIIKERVGTIDRFDPTASGIKMSYSDIDGEHSVEAALAVAAVGWCVDAERLGLRAAGIATTERGIEVDEKGRTSAPNVYAAGDVVGGAMLAPQAMHEGFIAASAAIGLPGLATAGHLIPIGSFTDPEYARVGMTEAQARRAARSMTISVPLDTVTRPIVDGRTEGFCKLIADRSSRQILGCSIVGERAVDTVQVAAVAMAAEMRVDQLAYFPLSFPIYAGALSQAAAKLTYRLNREE